MIIFFFLVSIRFKIMVHVFLLKKTFSHENSPLFFLIQQMSTKRFISYRLKISVFAETKTLFICIKNCCLQGDYTLNIFK